MKIPKLFGIKKKKRNKFLLEEFNKCRILQVNNGVDNKEYLKQNDSRDRQTKEQNS